MTKQEQIAYAKGYKEAIKKTCDWLRNETDYDLPTPTNEKGEINTEVYCAMLERADHEMEKVIAEYVSFMEA